MFFVILTALYYLKLAPHLKKQYCLGYSDLKTTLDIYIHVTKKAKVEAIQKFVDYLEEFQ